jgi:predicted nucleotidyltransferase
MTHILNRLASEAKISPPKFVVDQLMMLVIQGSYAYGISTDKSDLDLYGVCIAPNNNIFWPPFEQYQKHHIPDGDKTVDVQVFNLAKFMHLCANNNPNVLEVLFVPRDCVEFSNTFGELLRTHRTDFVSKQLVPNFKGYALSQCAKLGREEYKKDSKRFPLLQQFGYDTKNAAHSLRLLLEGTQLVVDGSMDLRKHAELLTDVRAGKLTLREVKELFGQCEADFDAAARKSTLPETTDMLRIHTLTKFILKQAYGDVPL